MKHVLSDEELRYRQSLPLSIKVPMTRERIRSFIDEYGTDGVYVSFSGGKDSTVLLHIVRKYYPGVKAVFLDTWMEYPQIREFVKTFDNVEIIKPEKSMKQIIDDCGWCFPSKDVAEAVEAARRDLKWAVNKLHGLDSKGNPSEYRQQYKKWLPLIDAPFKISHRCCLAMKELSAKLQGKYTQVIAAGYVASLLTSRNSKNQCIHTRTIKEAD